jgi:hypothetical protein
MQHHAFHPDAGSVVEVDARTATCIVSGCGGAVVRHSLGGGQAVDRCIRCFRRYKVRPRIAAPPKGRLRRLLDEFFSWRDD